MVYVREANLSSNFNNFKDLSKLCSALEPGGLAQLIALPGGSKTQFAFGLSAQDRSTKRPEAGPPFPSCRAEAERRRIAPKQSEDGFFFWASDQGTLYPESLYHRWGVDPHRLLLVTLPEASDVWRVGLEAVQTGLFAWAFLRPSRGTSVAHLRKLQLEAEKTGTRVLLLLEQKLPNWMCRFSYAVDNETLSLLPQSQPHLEAG